MNVGTPRHIWKYCRWVVGTPLLGVFLLHLQTETLCWFVCVLTFPHFSVLYQQVHLQRKTAWSNTSLIGCRINCLVELKEWHEGFVLQFHKSGKHYVEFRQVNEKRWLIMKKIAFYILERPVSEGKEESEFKEDETEGLAPVEVHSLSYWCIHCYLLYTDMTDAKPVIHSMLWNQTNSIIYILFEHL